MRWMKKTLRNDKNANPIYVHVHDRSGKSFAKCWAIPGKKAGTPALKCRLCDAQWEKGDVLEKQVEKTRAQWIVLSGDWGGQIFLTVPKTLVTRSLRRVRQLLKKMNDVTWACNTKDFPDDTGASVQVLDDSSTDIYFDHKGRFMAGGMGGGVILDDAVWVHGHPDLLKISDTVIRQHLGITTDIRILRGSQV